MAALAGMTAASQFLHSGLDELKKWVQVCEINSLSPEIVDERKQSVVYNTEEVHLCKHTSTFVYMCLLF